MSLVIRRYFIVLVSVLMAILYGFFAVTANPIIIGLAAALIVGLVLLVKPSEKWHRKFVQCDK